MIDFTALFVVLVLVLLCLAILPWVVYGVAWLLSHAWYSGRMSAIRSAFYSKGKTNGKEEVCLSTERKGRR